MCEEAHPEFEHPRIHPLRKITEKLKNQQKKSLNSPEKSHEFFISYTF
jgi:hypothetical protein